MRIEYKNLIIPDPKTGSVPTTRQMDILLALNPFEYNRSYKQVAKMLGISESNVQSQMMRLKRRCPVIFERFRKVKLKWKSS